MGVHWVFGFDQPTSENQNPLMDVGGNFYLTIL